MPNITNNYSNELWEIIKAIQENTKAIEKSNELYQKMIDQTAEQIKEAKVRYEESKEFQEESSNNWLNQIFLNDEKIRDHIEKKENERFNKILNIKRDLETHEAVKKLKNELEKNIK